jgi:hypothetical protein
MENELIEKYSRDFSTDHAYAQLSVVSILRESVAEFVSLIPEIEMLPKGRKNEIEEQIVLFGLMLFDQGREHYKK